MNNKKGGLLQGESKEKLNKFEISIESKEALEIIKNAQSSKKYAGVTAETVREAEEVFMEKQSDNKEKLKLIEHNFNVIENTWIHAKKDLIRLGKQRPHRKPTRKPRNK